MMNNGNIISRAVDCVGKGFDLTSDFRLKYSKGKQRLILVNEDLKRPLFVPSFGTFGEPISIDIKCDKGDNTRHQSDLLDFNQMCELLNRKSGVPGKIPSGLFNSMFKYESGSSSWAKDAANTKMLGLNGYSIVLFNLHIDRYPLLLSDEVRNEVPHTWDPHALARFIEKYGTHIIVGISIGGQDMVLVKQDKSSKLEASELKKHLYQLGDELFTGTCNITPRHLRTKEHRQKAPPAFDIFEQQLLLTDSFSTVTSKDGITVICAKRGGDPSFISHNEWLQSVPSMPDAIDFSFIPITSLLKGVPGKGFLSHAINLYLRYKPPISDLHYFLDFQSHRVWAPLHNDLPLAPTANMPLSASTLHFNIFGPKLHVNTTQVNVNKRPITGMRLYLEGMKCNRLAIHLQHLTNTPMILQNKIEDTLFWRGSDEIADNDGYFEAVQKKKFSHICAAAVKYDPSWTYGRKNIAFIVTGAQLYTEQHGSKHVLHLRLLFSKASDMEVVQSEWGEGSSESSSSSSSSLFQKKPVSGSSPLSWGSLEREKEQVMVMDSSQFPAGPPVPVEHQKLLRFVDTCEICRGPQDNPGYWVATGAKLEVAKGKICLRVKFSLLNNVLLRIMGD